MAKAAVLSGDTLTKANDKNLQKKMPATLEKTLECLINLYKTVSNELQFSSQGLATPAVQANTLKMFDHLKP
ncbi:hypothetical protein DSO57_1025270 [Entomophthora muscae]|uniref:Uncharacterized protein n=1 Tax=Entomophthora muscae TaxID=34485 RepID=A0ACC2SRP0_9FUNG|nr:hypothetical protein DSO57_1025270 [Entomophthora muscae]